MINRLKTILKNNERVYIVYNCIGSFLLKIIGFFCKTDNKLVLFNSFGGKRFDDSPRVIYDYMISSGKYDNYKLVWAIDNPGILNDDTKYVKNNSFSFFLTALKAKYWITNSSMERGLKFKKKNTVYINTWHGSALKKMGNDTGKSVSKFSVSKSDIFYCQSMYDLETFSRAFDYNKNNMKIVGLPRNDELCSISYEEILKIKREIGIPENKKVILYAPTFREFCFDSKGCVLAPPIHIEKWKKELSNDYVVLFRAHYEVSKVLNIINDDFIYNVTDYSCLNDLMKISDILISDYSSIMIDYSILERPIFSYAYDYDEYSEKRGLYFDLGKELPNGIVKTEDELLSQIVNCDFVIQKKKTSKFKNKFVEVCGNSRKYIDDIILGGER